MADDVLAGPCFCGALRSEIPAAPAGVVCCHGAECRNMHGTYNAMLAAPRSEPRLLADAPLLW